MAITIFAVCNEASPDVLADWTLIVDIARKDCFVVPKTDPMPGDSAVIVCRTESRMRMLRDYLVRSSPIADEKARGCSAEVSGVAAGGVQHQ